MKVTSKPQLKKSLLLSRDISLKDIVNPSQRTLMEKSAIFMRKPAHTASQCDATRQLFSGLSYKKIDSIDTNDGEANTPEKPQFKRIESDPVVQQKLRQQYDKLKKSMSNTCLARAMNNQGQQNMESEQNNLKTLKRVKKEDELKKFAKIRKLSETISMNM